jgi:AraC-like DNA-binding protein
MSRNQLIHLAEQHRSTLRGIEAISIVSNRQFPRHAHDQFGMGVMTFGAHRTWSPIGTVEAETGDVVTINPGEMHDGVPIAGKVRGWRMLFFEPHIVTAEIDDEPNRVAEIAQPVLRDPALKTWCERLFAHLTAAQPDRLALEETLLRTLMLAFARHGAERHRAQRSAAIARSSIAKALQRLDDASQTAISLSELAALSGVSRFQLLRSFARELGVTPYAYLLQRRVRAARRLLAAGRSPAEAAAETGFADQSHMTRAFARQLGITPARYRAAVV